MSLPQIVSREEWTAARTALLADEKALTRARDALNTRRRELPMVEIEKDYVFDGPEGTVGLLEMFDGRRQLMVGHFMFDPEWDAGCPSCSAGADEWSPGLQRHLGARDTTLVHISRAPLEKIERYKAEKGWGIRWYSSYGSDFNYDFGVSFDAARGPAVYNYRPMDEPYTGELPGLSCFLRDGDRVFHTYSQFARGAESTGGSYYFLDLTALGRQEEWEEPKGRVDHARPATPNFEE
ncbi:MULTISPECIES: DUF899 domain-containing protein [unclassified Pseudonocardia]|uniref:DUF899 domain-containing protein n=1 Tax=unclassified Pseudonocardia TaxID=2619320 RepID=UPI00095F5926|nr:MULTISPECIES: DUF899 domain-containing protein [unclassified Pseudonocardia]MBN9101591.1 DUF899 domain-containing protein [Pseudonocardia sp.]OJY44696.1 MAG: hypothetical protein BGP03_34350 [Pseudonocardia sp. 73-21]